MNASEAFNRELKLKTNIARWMETHGETLEDRAQCNPYVLIRIRRIRWRGRVYQLIDVDWMTCRIERIE